MDETSQPIELLLSVTRDGALTLSAQIQQKVRDDIRSGTLRPGARVPSTRDLARQLGISRHVAVDAYEQLAAEGYLQVRQGARPRVAETAALAAAASVAVARVEPRPRYDFSPSVPDVSAFPRSAWLRSLREALVSITDGDLGYGDPRGVTALRVALAEYLGRVRGVVAEPERVVVTSGFTQGLGLACQALAAVGARTIALDEPSNPDQRVIAVRAGLEPIPLDVDDAGVRVDQLRRARPDAVIVAPAHQHPTGALLSDERRTALISWLRTHGAIAIEDDYDADYRYDRAAVGALQGLQPDRVVYAGSASKTLAPALRLGWLVVPPALLEAVGNEKLLADRGTARIDQLAFSDFLARGDLDRHLRRMRARYRARRQALVDTLAEALPDAVVRGIPAGLHVTVELDRADDQQAIRTEAERRGVAFETMADYRPNLRHNGPPTLFLGFAQMPEDTIRAGIHELSNAVHATRQRA